MTDPQQQNSRIDEKVSHEMDPLAALLSDPESHYSDVLYVYFRIYKKRVLGRFFETALQSLNLQSSATLCMTDIGASMGFDLLYLVKRLTANFRQPLPFDGIECSLIEGDKNLIERGELSLKTAIESPKVGYRYYQHPLVEAIPIADDSQDVILCSEVVEHLEHPEALLREIFRILKTGGFLLFTTDNSPSFPQHIRRLPVLLTGNYREVYSRPPKNSEIVGATTWNGKEYPIYGHINLNPTRHWERLCEETGFKIHSYGTYESIRRGGASSSPLVTSLYFAAGAMVYYLMPRSLGRFFGDTTALLLRK